MIWSKSTKETAPTPTTSAFINKNLLFRQATSKAKMFTSQSYKQKNEVQ